MLLLLASFFRALRLLVLLLCRTGFRKILGFYRPMEGRLDPIFSLC